MSNPTAKHSPRPSYLWTILIPLHLLLYLFKLLGDLWSSLFAPSHHASFFPSLNLWRIIWIPLSPALLIPLHSYPLGLSPSLYYTWSPPVLLLWLAKLLGHAGERCPALQISPIILGSWPSPVFTPMSIRPHSLGFFSLTQQLAQVSSIPLFIY